MGFGLTLEGGAEDGRGFDFAFHGEHEAFGHGFGALEARLSGFGVGDEVGEAFAHGWAHGIEELPEIAIRFEDFCEFGREVDDHFAEIGREFEEGALSGADAGASLHLPVDDEDLALAFGGGDQRGFEREAVDFAEHAAALPHGPRFPEVDGDADDDPAERGAGGFERGAEGFGEFWLHGVTGQGSGVRVRGSGVRGSGSRQFIVLQISRVIIPRNCGRCGRVWKSDPKGVPPIIPVSLAKDLVYIGLQTRVALKV
jgi:hypothetical protein